MCCTPQLCATCPLRLAHKDPSWRFGAAHAHTIRPAVPADEDAIGVYIMAMPDTVRERRYHYKVSAERIYELRLQNFRDNPPDDWHHLELVIGLPCGGIGGVCHAYNIPQFGYHEVGISISPGLAGRSAASALLRRMTAHARQSTHVKKLFANTEVINHSMQRLAQACGYRGATIAERTLSCIDVTESPWMLEL